MPWINVTFQLVNEIEGAPTTPYTPPAGTALLVFGPAASLAPPFGPPLARYNLSENLWQDGGFAAVQDGQWLVLQGMVSPGHYKVDGTYSTFSGPSLSFTATFDRATWTMYLPLGVE